jgi:hypothetical protein
VRAYPVVALRWMARFACLFVAIAVIFASRARSVRPGDAFAGVVEPIAVTGVALCDDGGSRSIELTDSTGRKFFVCWIAEEYGGNILPGRFSPIHDPGRLASYPLGGTGDRSVLGLLDRWARRDSEAQRLEGQIALSQGVESKIMDVGKKAIGEGTYAKYIDVLMLEELRRRCHGEEKGGKDTQSGIARMCD